MIQRGGRADRMTVDDPTSHPHTPLIFAEQGAGEIRFSPNFSVYVLPPDVVCLYSENRKIFLRGELYCAVATRIGEGASPEAIVEALAPNFPPGKIDEAIDRLLQRSFVVSEDLIDHPAAGYWTSLGLPNEIAL